MIANGLKDLTVTGTCFEYGFVEGCLSEDLISNPANPYGIAKDCLQKFLSQLQKLHGFSFKWVRLFYMYGDGQNAKSLFSQIDKAIEEGQEIFNMSGGEQIRDYLPVRKVVKYIRDIASQQAVTGIINCCSGQPTRLKDVVLNYLKEKESSIKLNLGYYPYLDYEPMEFWGDDSKLKSIISKA
jgi:dTDP-6-deoxy-L-talose 4-dehydrogenase (NAD+)